MALNTSFILVIFRLLLKDRFSVAFFQMAFVFESAVIFSKKGRFSIQRSLESSSFGLHLGMVAILSWFVRSKAEKYREMAEEMGVRLASDDNPS